MYILDSNKQGNSSQKIFRMHDGSHGYLYREVGDTLKKEALSVVSICLVIE